MYLFIVGANIQKKNIFREIFTQINCIQNPQTCYGSPNASTIMATCRGVNTRWWGE